MVEKIVDIRNVNAVLFPEGWGLKEYIEYAVKNHGYELILIWGEQGSGKSNYLLQLGYMIFGNWGKVFEHLIFTPNDLIRKAKELPEGWKYDALLWDDVGVHFPATKYKTDIETYEKMAEFMDAHRTIASVIICTAPNWTRYPKVLRDNCTIEIYLLRDREIPLRSYAWAYRHVKLLSLDGYQGIYKFKKELERLTVNYKNVPEEIWSKYWSLRLKLARESLIGLEREILKEEEWIDIYTASLKANLPIETINYKVKTGLLKAKKINGLLHIERESLEKFLQYNKREVNGEK